MPYPPEQHELLWRFFQTLKEAYIWRHWLESLAYARHVVGEWIPFYN
jgi:hypothetical protein